MCGGHADVCTSFLASRIWRAGYMAPPARFFPTLESRRSGRSGPLENHTRQFDHSGATKFARLILLYDGTLLVWIRYPMTYQKTKQTAIVYRCKGHDFKGFCFIALASPERRAHKINISDDPSRGGWKGALGLGDRRPGCYYFLSHLSRRFLFLSLNRKVARTAV